MKRKLNFLLVLLLFGVGLVSAQQNLSVSGVVTDAGDGSPLVGVSVLVKGSTVGTITDMSGKYTLKAAQGATLVFSYIGMEKQQEIVKTGIVNAAMSSNSKMLNEVVAVGYGTMKKKLVTGATVQVAGDKLQKQSTTSAFTALQSQTPGVNITQSSGQPGEGFKVNIRGIGTVKDSKPLYIIDGVAGGDLNNLNNSDIESIDVLKDGASAAIYGARAANGVILVTTKQGKSGKMQLSYDGYVGIQNVYKQPDLLNAQQYMNVQDQINFNEGLPLNDWKTILGSNYDAVKNGTWKGTNWLDLVRNQNAPTQNHSINIAGGNEISKFSMGLSNTSQEGIYGSPVQSKYNRTTVRLNSDHVLLKNKSFDVVKFGETLNYNYSEKSGIAIGNQYTNDLSNMLRAMPIMPVTDTAGSYYANIGTGLTSFEPLMSNPIADMVNQHGSNLSKNYNLNASANIQIQPIKNLIFKSQFGYKMSASSYRSFTPTYKLSTSDQSLVSKVTQNAGSGWSYTLENTLNYKYILGEHHFDALIGQSIEKWGMGENLMVNNTNMLFNDFSHAYAQTSQDAGSSTTVRFPDSYGNGPWGQGGLASFFGRVNYDYKETYMASLVMRADGSSNFAKGKRWGYFPSVSAGWVISNEAFMESTKDWMDFLKLRGSWGQNGNCNIDNFQYLATVSFDATAAYSFGNAKDSQTTGGYADINPNPDVKWETSEQTDFGLDARFFNSRLSLAFDYYNKATKNWLVRAPALATNGTTIAAFRNGGDIVNKGFEVALGWNDHIGKDFTYGVNTNVSFNHNEVTRIQNTEGVIHGQINVLSQGTGEIYRAQEGYSVGYFYGYHTSGIFQNQADIDSWRAAGNGILQSNVQPGDVKFTDVNHDNKIDEKDKGQIGDPNPDFTLGINLNFGYKGFDLNIAAHGAFGQQIARSYRKFGDGRHENYTSEVFEAWHGEGTSNKWPRLTAGSNANYMNLSDLYIENGDYLKLQNVSLGYDFKKLFPKMPLSQARLYVTAQNLLTITGYKGSDPEIGSDGGTGDAWASGIDLGFYPSPRTYLVGVNIKF